MSIFVIFNIQLLPNSDKVQEVGIRGYKKLFSELRNLNDQHKRDGTISNFHYALPGDNFIGPKEFNFPAGYVSGKFVRYIKTEKLTDLHTGTTVFNAGKKTATSSTHGIPFVFDTSRHLLAIDKAHLPNCKIIAEILNSFLKDISATHFPDHNLEINLVSEKKALEEIFENATAYSKVEVTLSFPNGTPTENLLRELQENRTQLNIKASPGKKGKMPGIPEFLKEMLRAAATYGKSTISYFIKNEAGQERQQKYDSEETPVMVSARLSSSSEPLEDFYGRVAKKIAQIDVTLDAMD